MKSLSTVLFGRRTAPILAWLAPLGVVGLVLTLAPAPAAAKSANRSTACPSRYTRPTGRSCDEYPFASTNQGAWVMAGIGGTARTFTYCQVPEPTGVVGPIGWSACMINATHNSGGGSALGSFYLSNRVVDGDAFHVAILG